MAEAENDGVAEIEEGMGKTKIEGETFEQLLETLSSLIQSLSIPENRVVDDEIRRQTFGKLYNLVDKLIFQGAILKSSEFSIKVSEKQPGRNKNERDLRLIANIDKEEMRKILDWLNVNRDLYNAIFRKIRLNNDPVVNKANNEAEYLFTILQTISFDMENNLLSDVATIRNLDSRDDGLYAYICRRCPLDEQEIRKVCFISKNKTDMRNDGSGNCFKNLSKTYRSQCKKRIDWLKDRQRDAATPAEPPYKNISIPDHVAKHFLDNVNLSSENAFALTYVVAALPTGIPRDGEGNHREISSWKVFWNWITLVKETQKDMN